MVDAPILITGASRGIGRAVAQRLATLGPLAIHYNQSKGSAQSLREEILDAGGHATCFAADLSEPGAPYALVDAVRAASGPLGAVVHCAGVARGGVLISRDCEGVQETIQVNLTAALHLAAAVSRDFIRRRAGRFVVMSSVVGLCGGSQGQVAYAASKAGLVGLIKTFANELSPRGDITANAVSPGVIPTDMSAAGIAAIGDIIKHRIPAGRFGDASEVAEVVAFLLSPGASYINGQEIVVDGGYSLNFINRRRLKTDPGER